MARYRLFPLVVLTTIGPPILAAAWFYPVQAAMVALFVVVAALPRRGPLPA
jgi:hypothetical protein